MYREIKRKFYAGCREDPEARIEIQVDDDVFNTSLGSTDFFLNPNGPMEMRKLTKQLVEAVDKYQRSQLQVLP